MKERIVSVRLTEDEHAQLVAWAKAERLSLSEALRRAVRYRTEPDRMRLPATVATMDAWGGPAGLTFYWPPRASVTY